MYNFLTIISVFTLLHFATPLYTNEFVCVDGNNVLTKTNAESTTSQEECDANNSDTCLNMGDVNDP